MLSRVDQLKIGHRITDETNSSHKTQAVRIHRDGPGGVIHDGADEIMGDEQTIQFLDYTLWLVRMQWGGQETLMGIQFVNGQLNLPAFMIETNQVEGRISDGVEQGGQQPMHDLVAGTLGVIEGVFNDADRDTLSCRVSV